MADVTAAEVRLQEHFLKELESEDFKQMETVKEMMRRNIENGNKATADWTSAIKW